MAKHKSGLHKEITAIFDGVRIPRPGEAPQAVSGQSAPAAQQPVPPPQTESAESSQAEPAAPSQAATKLPPPEPPKPPQIIAKRAAAKKSSIGLAGLLARVKVQLESRLVKGGDSKQKIMLVLMPVLFVALIFMLTKSLKSVSPDAGEAGSAAKVAAAAAVVEFEWPMPEQYPATLRDPMKIGSVSTSAATAESGPPVRGIMYSMDRPSAIVGDRIVYEGDILPSGVKVIKINPDSVEFESNEKRWTQKVQ